jgi:hypothetical protein
MKHASRAYEETLRSDGSSDPFRRRDVDPHKHFFTYEVPEKDGLGQASFDLANRMFGGNTGWQAPKIQALAVAFGNRKEEAESHLRSRWTFDISLRVQFGRRMADLDVILSAILTFRLMSDRPIRAAGFLRNGLLTSIGRLEHSITRRGHTVLNRPCQAFLGSIATTRGPAFLCRAASATSPFAGIGDFLFGIPLKIMARGLSHWYWEQASNEHQQCYPVDNMRSEMSSNIDFRYQDLPS